MSSRPPAERQCARVLWRGVVGRVAAAPPLPPALTRLPSPLAPPPSFYTTDFDEVDEIFNLKKNPNLPMEELDAMLEEFRK